MAVQEVGVVVAIISIVVHLLVALRTVLIVGNVGQYCLESNWLHSWLHLRYEVFEHCVFQRPHVNDSTVDDAAVI